MTYSKFLVMSTITCISWVIDQTKYKVEYVQSNIFARPFLNLKKITFNFIIWGTLSFCGKFSWLVIALCFEHFIFLMKKKTYLQ